MRKLKGILLSKTFLILSFLFVCTYVYGILSNQFVNTNYKEGFQCVTGIIEEKQEKEYSVSFILKSKEKLIGNAKDFSYEVGDLVEVCGVFSYPSTNTNFHLFSYRNYLLSKKIAFQVSVEESKLVKQEANSFFTLKKKMNSFLSSYQSSRYLKTFLLGNQIELEEETKENYQNLGISHLFSISGMHVGFLSGILLFLFQKIRVKRVSYLITSIFLLFYSCFVFTPSILRATIFFCFIGLKKCFSISISNTIAFYYLTCLFLLINPYYLYHTGFLYSFTISFCLIYFSESIKQINHYWKKLLFISVLSFFIGIPISLFINFEINPASIVLNLLFVPLVTCFFFPMAFLTLLFPFLDSFYASCLSYLEFFSSFISSYIHPIIVGYPRMFVILYFLFGFYAIKGITLKKQSYLIPLFVCIILQRIYPYCNPNFFFTMLDVGEGNAMLIELPYRKGVIMIDTGGKYMSHEYTYPISKNILIPYLKMKGIRKVDTLIITHGDADHMKEAKYLTEHFEVENVVFNQGDYNKLEQELVKVLKEKKIPYYQGLKELEYQDFKFFFLNTGLYEDENNNSNVIYFQMKQFQFLLMGDAEKEKEWDLLKQYSLKNIDFLQVGHHGSNTSSTKEFIDRINPKYSLISVGKNNRYGHPKDSVLDILNSSKIYRTDLDGSIEIKLSKNGYKIKTCLP